MSALLWIGAGIIIGAGVVWYAVKRVLEYVVGRGLGW